MKRLITVFALIAALFVLMGCGMGSKGTSERTEPSEITEPSGVTESLTYTLYKGDYSSKDSGEMYVAGTQKSDIDSLLNARKVVEDINSQIAALEKQLSEEAIVEDKKVELNQEIEKLKASLPNLSELEDRAKVDFKITSLSFSILHNEDGSSKMENFSIETDKDPQGEVEVTKEDGTAVKEMQKVGRLFGNGEKDINKIVLNDVVSFDSHSRDLSFSFSTGEGESLLTYTFKGQTSDRMIEDSAEKKIREVILSGDIEVIGKDPEAVNYGKWSVSRTIDETPAKEEPKVEEEKVEDALVVEEAPKVEEEKKE